MKTDSMTNLLKQNNNEMSVVKANKVLVALELLEDKERPSSPGQPTPHYYVEMFQGV